MSCPSFLASDRISMEAFLQTMYSYRQEQTKPITPFTLQDCVRDADTATKKQQERAERMDRCVYNNVRDEIGDGTHIKRAIVAAIARGEQSVLAIELKRRGNTMDLVTLVTSDNIVAGEPSLFRVIESLFASQGEFLVVLMPGTRDSLTTDTAAAFTLGEPAYKKRVRTEVLKIVIAWPRSLIATMREKLAGAEPGVVKSEPEKPSVPDPTTDEASVRGCAPNAREVVIVGVPDHDLCPW